MLGIGGFMQNLSLGLIFIPMVLSIAIYLLDRRTLNRMSLAVQPVLFLMTGRLLIEIMSSGQISFVLGGWARGVGIPVYMDYKSIIFMILTVIGITYCVAFDWFSHRDDHKYLFFLLFLEGALMAVFQAGDVFTLFILLELITILVCILITYKKEGVSVKAGLYYLLVNSVGMTIYLLGVILLYNSTGVLDMMMLKSLLAAGPLTTIQCAALGCFITAFAVKTAMFPVGSWLPLAHGSAPTQISALLSGLLVKLGIFSLLRFMDIFDMGKYLNLILIIGIATAFFGVIMAMLQRDIKLILAYHTVSQMGLILMGMASGKANGFIGSLLHDINHFLFKSLLFLGAGVAIQIYGTRDIRQMRGLMKAHPVVGASLFVGVLGITGAPVFDGSLSKILIEESFIGEFSWYLIALVNLGTIISFLKFSTIFIGFTDRELSVTVDRWKTATVVAMAMLTMITYPIELLYFDSPWADVHFTQQILITGAIEFAVLLVIGIFTYKRGLKPLLVRHPYAGLRRMGFQSANSMILLFLTAMWSYFAVIRS